MTALTGETPPIDGATGKNGPDSQLDARYGRTGSSRRRARLIGFGAAGVFAVVLAAWLGWGGVLEGLDTVDSQNIGHQVLSDSEVEIRFQVSVEPGITTACALQALNESFGIVGWEIVELPPTENRTRSVDETVRTSEQSVTGLIYRCWRT